MFKFIRLLLEDYEGKKVHSKRLVDEVFQYPVINDICYQYDEIRSNRVEWGISSQMFPYVAQHLKHRNYKELCQAYEYAKDYAEGIIADIENKIQQYRKAVEQKLIEAQIQIPVSEKFIDYKMEHYYQRFVKHIIFHEIKRSLKHQPKENELEIDGSALRWGNTAFAVGSISSREYLKDVIQKIEGDKTIIDMVLYIESKRLFLDNNIWLKRFNIKREEIVKRVKYENKTLWGTCDGCPD